LTRIEAIISIRDEFYKELFSNSVAEDNKLSLYNYLVITTLDFKKQFYFTCLYIKDNSTFNNADGNLNKLIEEFFINQYTMNLHYRDELYLFNEHIAKSIYSNELNIIIYNAIDCALQFIESKKCKNSTYSIENSNSLNFL